MSSVRTARNGVRCFCPVTVAALVLTLVVFASPTAWGGERIVTTCQNLIILELGDDDFVPGNLFDLAEKTIRFTPEGSGYRAKTIAFQWDSDFGTVIGPAGFPSNAVEIRLNNFQFPFSGTNWTSFFVNNLGSISFGADQEAFYDPVLHSNEFQDFGGSMVNTIPIISPLFHRRLGGFDSKNINRIYFKELSDRVLVTWTMSESYGGVADFITEPRLNYFQATLHDDGTIEFSYDQIEVDDGVVGLFTINSTEKFLGKIVDPEDLALPEYVDALNVTASLVGSSSIRISFETRGPILLEGDPAIDGLVYRAFVDLDEPFMTGVDYNDPEFNWGIGGSPGLTYSTAGPGVSPNIQIDGNTISLTASLGALAGMDQFAFFVDIVDFDIPGAFDQTDPVVVTLPELPSTQVDFSKVSPDDRPRDIPFETFHYPSTPDLRDVICAVIGTLGDEFDFFSTHTDFRIDHHEARAPATGPVGSAVTGIGGTIVDPSEYCSAGRFQSSRLPLPIGTPLCAPEGVDAGGAYDNYNRHTAQLAHELGHRWGMPVDALVNGVDIGDSGHWDFALHAPVAFPIAEPFENSRMGGEYWQDNGDGTFTALGRTAFSQSEGFSYLDLYLMGFLPAEEVPDFFLIQSLSYVGVDGNGNAVWSGDRLDITVEDEIAANGPRLPAFEDSQKNFNIGFVGIVPPGASPSPLLLERLSGIRQAWLEYWPIATGGVSTMTSIAGPCSPCSSVTSPVCFSSGSDVDLNWDNGDCYDSVQILRDSQLIATLPGSPSNYADLNLPAGIYSYDIEGGCGDCGVSRLTTCVVDHTPLENDDCGNALTVFEGTTAFDTTEATTDGPSESGRCNAVFEGLLGKIDDPQEPSLPGYIDALSVSAFLEGTFIRISFQTRGPILPEGDPAVNLVVYRAWIDLDEPFVTSVDFDDPDFTWEIGGTPGLTYSTSGPGVSPNVTIDGNTISLTASLDALAGMDRFAFFVDLVDFDDPATPFDQTNAVLITLPEQAWNDVWFRYDATCDGDVTASLCESSYDTAISIYPNICLGDSAIACNDDFCGLQSEVTFPSVAGSSYLIRVGGHDGATGTGQLTISCESSLPDFIRGDANGDGVFNGLIDSLHILEFQFQNGARPPCRESGDGDGNGVFNGLIDALYVLTHQFQGGPPPPPPYPECGPDPDPDSSIGCESHPRCR